MEKLSINPILLWEDNRFRDLFIEMRYRGQRSYILKASPTKQAINLVALLPTI